MRIRIALLWMVCCAACSNPVKHCTRHDECTPAFCEQGFCVVDSGTGSDGGAGTRDASDDGGTTDGGEADAGNPLVMEILAPAPPMRSNSVNVRIDDPLLGATAWKRDESLTLEVRSNKPLVGAPSLRVSGPQRDGGVSAFTPNGIALTDSLCCADGGGSTCFCFVVSLPLVPFEAFNGSIRFEARGDSDAGSAVSRTESVRMTRWRWSSQILQSADTSRAPALDSEGRVLVGGQSDPTNGRVVSVLPDGEIAWQVVGGAVSAPVAVAYKDKGGVYVPRRTAGGAYVERLGSEGDLRPSCNPAPSFTILSAISLNQLPPGPAEQLIAIAEDATGHKMLGHRPSDGV